MIPKIYGNRLNDTSSRYSYPSQNAIGRLYDVISCKVTQERNGVDELELEYPIDGRYYEELKPMSIIGVTVNGEDKGYVIYKITKRINKTVIINAFHSSYYFKYCVFNPPTQSWEFSKPTSFTNMVQLIFNKFQSKDYEQYKFADWGLPRSHNPIDFTLSNGITTLSSKEIKMTDLATIDKPITAREAIGGMAGSVLDKRGGDFVTTKTGLKWVDHQGKDNGFEIRYGKNMTGITWYADYSDVYTACVPYYKSGDTLVTTECIGGGTSSTPGSAFLTTYETVDTVHKNDYPYVMVKPLDLSSEFDDEPTVDQLKTRALSYMNTNKVWEPAISIDIKFRDLSKTSDYKHIARAEQFGIGDDVKVINDELGIEVVARVESIEYDVINEQIDVATLGNKKVTYADVINKMR